MEHSPYQHSSYQFLEIDKLILKLYGNTKDLKEPKQSLKKSNKIGKLTVPNFNFQFKDR